ncbi:MAG TPA: hypothetical protein VK099_08430 [Alcanivoracaceae bacterium]|nr:hypothetical protein [Alcanivoracaceae bacterium]
MGLSIREVPRLSIWFLLLIFSLEARTEDGTSPVVEEKDIPLKEIKKIFREETSAHPDGYLFDPESWIHDEEANEIVVQKEGVEKRRYEIPEGCAVYSFEAGDLKMVDMLHHRFSRGLCAPSQWLDTVFGDPFEKQHEEAGTTIRIVGSQLFQDNNEQNNDVRFKARVNLPYLEDRLSLVVGSERDFEDTHAGLQGSPETTGTDAETSSLNAALQWARQRSNGWQFRVRLGLHSGFKGRAKFRFRKENEINDKWLWRFTEEIEWRDQKGWGTETYIDFDRPIGPVRLFRATSRVAQSKELHKQGRAENWEQSFSVAAQLNKRVAMLYSVSAEGYTKPQHRVEAYRARVIYRRNTWRPWFYYEVEPYLLWAREHNYNTTWGIVFRVETLFGQY